MKIILLTFFYLSTFAIDKNVSIGKYIKCYELFTDSSIPVNDEILMKIQSGVIDQFQACELLLKKSELSENYRLKNDKDKIAIKVLNRFQALHNSWFSSYLFDMQKDFPLTYKLLEQDAIATRFTMSLFSPQVNHSDILKGSKVVTGVRISSKKHETQKTSYKFIPIQEGELVGFQFAPSGINVFEEYVDHLFYPKKFKAKYDTNIGFGGGVLGLQSYILQNHGRVLGEKSDGGRKVFRKYSEQIVKDLTCRSLPVITGSAIKKYVDTKSSLSFVKKESCMNCHSTMDYMAGVFRSFEMIAYDNSGNSFATIYKHPESDHLAGNFITHETDVNYYKKPNWGRFIYQSLDNTIFDEEIRNLDDLGTSLSKVDEFYSCLAYRYYVFLTGDEIMFNEIYQKEKTEYDDLRKIINNFRKRQDSMSLLIDLVNSKYFK